MRVKTRGALAPDAAAIHGAKFLDATLSAVDKVFGVLARPGGVSLFAGLRKIILNFILSSADPGDAERNSLGRTPGGEIFFILGYIDSRSNSGSDTSGVKNLKFLLTLSRVNDLMFHSAQCRRHNDASPHLCLAGEVNLSSIPAPCNQGCCWCADSG